MKSVVLFLFMILSYVLQTVLINSHIRIFGVTPDLGMAMIVSVAIFNGMFYGGTTGFFYGMLIGVFFGYSRLTSIFYIFEYAAVGVFAGFISRYLKSGLVVRPILIVAAGYLLKELIDVIPKLILHITAYSASSVVILCIGLFTTVILVVPVHLLMNRIHRWRFMRAPDDDRIFID